MKLEVGVGFIGVGIISSLHAVGIKGTEGYARYSFNDRVGTARKGTHTHTYLEWDETIANEDAHFTTFNS